jgi:type II secretory ATPase GspE/PulE/Tfp pilus assembly ATPase PilB-like protein
MEAMEVNKMETINNENEQVTNEDENILTDEKQILALDVNSSEVKYAISEVVNTIMKNDAEFKNILRNGNIVPFYINKRDEIIYFIYDENTYKNSFSDLITKRNLIRNSILNNGYNYRIEVIAAPTSKVQLIITTYFTTDKMTTNKEIITEENLRIDNETMREATAIISEAISKHASDIHFSSKGETGFVKIRINGQLITFLTKPRMEIAKIIRYLMNLAHVSNPDPIVPANGRFSMLVNGDVYDFRFASIGIYPSDIHSVMAVVRILYKDKRTLDDLGFEDVQKQKLLDSIQREGIIILSGPTGSGKTTTMYALLDAADLKGKKVITIEDPPEILREQFDQIEVRPRRGITWEEALRISLRLDPDVLIIGEIRDSLAADIAIQAAITGHTVLTTIHVDKVEDIPQRFIQLATGAESHIAISTVAASITAMVSQRLIKKLYRTGDATNTAQELPISQYYLDKFSKQGYNIAWDRDEIKDIFNDVYYRSFYPNPDATDLSKGYYGGYDMSKNGRTVIAEVVTQTDELRKLIESKAEPSKIREYLRNLELANPRQHISMISHAVKKMNEGLISIKDVGIYL